MAETIYEKLTEYQNSDYYGFHMPGHKRNVNLTGADLPYEIDITEIEGFDDLHHARGILKQAQERAAMLYGAEETCFLVNGSTAGILSAIMGCTQKGDRILVARNCHKSVYHAIFLNELRAEYVYPQYLEKQQLNGEICVEDVKRILKDSDSKAEQIRAVVIVSPTYDGVVSDVRAIAEVVHEYGIPLIVDEAHGAHFGFHPYFPQNSNLSGADVVIHSLHKTLPSLTQTALIHINGMLADREEIHRFLHIFQSSSPSYVLMASMDECVNLLAAEGKNLFDSYVKNLQWMRAELKQMHCLHLEELPRYDCSKIVISTKGLNGKENEWSGRELYNILLERYHLQMEMAAGSYVIAMTSVGDTREGMERFVKALLEIDAQLCNDRKIEGIVGATVTKAAVEKEYKAKEHAADTTGKFELPKLMQVYTSAETVRILRCVKKKNETIQHIRETCKKEKEYHVERIPWEECEGMISAEYAYLYPPGIPLLVPGERISRQVLEILERYRNLGFEIEGLGRQDNILVLKS